MTQQEKDNWEFQLTEAWEPLKNVETVDEAIDIVRSAWKRWARRAVFVGIASVLTREQIEAMFSPDVKPLFPG